MFLLNQDSGESEAGLGQLSRGEFFYKDFAVSSILSVKHALPLPVMGKFFASGIGHHVDIFSKKPSESVTDFPGRVTTGVTRLVCCQGKHGMPCPYPGRRQDHSLIAKERNDRGDLPINTRLYRAYEVPRRRR